MNPDIPNFDPGRRPEFMQWVRVLRNGEPLSQPASPVDPTSPPEPIPSRAAPPEAGGDSGWTPASARYREPRVVDHARVRWLLIAMVLAGIVVVGAAAILMNHNGSRRNAPAVAGKQEQGGAVKAVIEISAAERRMNGDTTYRVTVSSPESFVLAAVPFTGTKLDTVTVEIMSESSRPNQKTILLTGRGTTVTIDGINTDAGAVLQSISPAETLEFPEPPKRPSESTRPKATPPPTPAIGHRPGDHENTPPTSAARSIPTQKPKPKPDPFAGLPPLERAEDILGQAKPRKENPPKDDMTQKPDDGKKSGGSNGGTPNGDAPGRDEK